jgi:hypothetical protein
MPPTPPFPGGFANLDPATIAFLVFVGKILLLWFVNMAITGWLAGRRGRDGGLWAVIAFFTGPIALIALLLKPKKDPIPEAEAARLDLAPPRRVRLLSDSELELDVDGRPVRLQGRLAARINGRPSFSVARSAGWQWADGNQMTNDERARLMAEAPAVAKQEGWILTLDAADLAR